MNLASQLLSRRADLEDIVSENKIVEDVLSGRSAIVGRTSRKPGGIAPKVVVEDDREVEPLL